MNIVISNDCKTVTYKENSASKFKFKARTKKLLYTIVMTDPVRAKKVKDSIGAKLFVVG